MHAVGKLTSLFQKSQENTFGLERRFNLPSHLQLRRGTLICDLYSTLP